MPAPNEQAPLSDTEADECLWPCLASVPALLLAVSGGVDSMVLMHLVHDVAQRHALPVRVVVATVDHGLRPEAADEAAFVAHAAHCLTLNHVTCVWSGAKPSTGLPAAARAARYALLAAAARDAGTGSIATAHTRDDQAETVLMRLARGSGVDGLSGMAPASNLPTEHGTIRLIRPLLDIPKSRLIATAQNRHIAWREDPTNARVEFERSRLRQALVVLDDLGITGAAIARSARRLTTAREALAAETVRLLSDPTCLHLDPLGYATLNRATWREVPHESRVRMLAAVIPHVGGVRRFLSLARLEQIAHGLSQDTFTITYARTKISLSTETVRLQREAGRAPDDVQIGPGETVVWDNRFRVTCFAARGDRPLTVRHLGPEGLKLLKDLGLAPDGIRTDILHTVPAFWSAKTLVSVPILARQSDADEPVNDDGGMWFCSRDDLITGLTRKHIDE